MSNRPNHSHAADADHYGAADVAPFPGATWHYSDPSTWGPRPVSRGINIVVTDATDTRRPSVIVTAASITDAGMDGARIDGVRGILAGSVDFDREGSAFRVARNAQAAADRVNALTDDFRAFTVDGTLHVGPDFQYRITSL